MANRFDFPQGARTGALRTHGIPAAALISASLLLGLGCDHDQVSRSTSTKEGAPAAAPAPGAMPGGELPPPPRPSGAGAMKWALPKGWTEAPGSQMRFATLTPPGPGKAELSVVVLPAPAGGELANVNRWRGQLGLPPWDDQALAAARKAVKAKPGAVSVYDFSSEGQTQSRMVAGLLNSPDGNIWFFKLNGEAAAVGKAKPEFMKFLETLHLD